MRDRIKLTRCFLLLSLGFGSYSNAGLQAKRVSRHRQVSHTWKNVHLSDSSANEDRLWSRGGVEAENADSGTAETVHPSSANRSVQEQYHDTNTVPEELFQRAEWCGYVLHDHRGRRWQQERLWFGNAQLEGCPGVQHLATVSGKNIPVISPIFKNISIPNIDIIPLGFGLEFDRFFEIIESLCNSTRLRSSG